MQNENHENLNQDQKNDVRKNPSREGSSEKKFNPQSNPERETQKGSGVNPSEQENLDEVDSESSGTSSFGSSEPTGAQRSKGQEPRKSGLSGNQKDSNLQ